MHVLIGGWVDALLLYNMDILINNCTIFLVDHKRVFGSCEHGLAIASCLSSGPATTNFPLKIKMKYY